jgi:hypothetical protein
MATSTYRAYEQFWARLMGRIHSDYPDWLTPADPPPRSWLTLGAEVSWFSFGVSFGHQKLCSELYIKVPGDAAGGQRIMSYLQARSAELEASYGRKLRYQYPSEMQRSDVACRLADYRSGSIHDTREHGEYLDWFLDSQVRLRIAVDSLGGLAAIRGQAHEG